ncbi:toxin-antitoxin system YwqK family antitoxin [Myroides odoratimimus]|uniref:YD repeat (Two copies) n=1 Tax=Myroides odoratimimus CIP 101113 TaxID=883154 RepID=A0AAV3F5C0_9FLAO|nr:hypothetical protein [Myroides odoratimimus]EHO13904.1 hypothetical protein HMPREF9715_00978 [Myroides odoratimimus CIP 101113]SHL74342.1 Antitoxin component YwqK of the YwqJK toxin-antitoxin module [Myroides odoratimimus subsp. xuanwuensis]
MIKKIFSLAILFSTPMFSQVARDTIWVDSYDYVTARKNAESFKIAKDIKGEPTLKSIEVYNAASKKIESKGKGTLQEGGQVLYTGAVNYYNKEGKIDATYTYDQDNMIAKAETIDPRNGNKYICTYSDNMIQDGQAIYNWQGTYIYVEAEGGIYTRYEIINPKNEKNYIAYFFDENNYITGEKYFDINGEVKQQATYSGGTPYDGYVTALDYDSFTVQSISEYGEGTMISTVAYYTTGKVKSKSTTVANVTTDVYYDQAGKEMGTFTSKLEDDGYSTYQEGTNYIFNTYDSHPDEIYSIYTYKQNVPVLVKEYYTFPKKNAVKSITYSNEESYIQKVEYFNEDGSSKGQITYNEDGYTPKEGTMIVGNVSSIYKNSKLVERTETYENGKVFEVTKNNTSVYYDQKGKEIGRIDFKLDPIYGSMSYITGTRYVLSNDLISTVAKYEKELLVYQADYDTNADKAVLSTESYYSNNALIKEVEYHDNGKKAKVSTYSPNSYSYTPVKETHFDKTGKEIGTYDYIAQTGTRIELSYDKQVTSIEKLQDGNLLSKKGYALKTGSNSYASNSYFLQADIDYNKQGKFYNEKGEIISTATYKDGVPYEGTVTIIDSYYKTETVYKNGHKVGKETIKYSSGDEIININYYDDKGELTKIESYENSTLKTSSEYKDNVIHGVSTYYDSEGEVLSMLTYHEGVPYEGVLTEASYINFTTKGFENGELTYVKVYNVDDAYSPTNLLMEEHYRTNTSFERTIYHAETEAIVYKYNLTDSELDGAYQYYENGKVKYQATFKDGTLVDGSVGIVDFNYEPYNYYSSYEASEDTSKYTVLSNKKGTYTISILNTDDNKEVFKMEAKVKKGDHSLNPLASKKIKLENLYPNNEYNVMSYYSSPYDYAVDAAATAVAADAAAVEATASAYYE